jgi:DNA-binding HxlR family transcriptional regulator
MFLNCAWREGQASWDGAERRNRVREANSKGHFTAKFSQKARHYEHPTGIENAIPDLYQQMDPQDLVSLKERPHRHGELRRHLGSVSQRMLTRTLRNLESAGLIARRVTRSRDIAVEYSLTQLGRTIIAPLGGMCRRAKRYLSPRRSNASSQLSCRGPLRKLDDVPDLVDRQG